MILAMTTITGVHVLLSLVAIAVGLVAIGGMIGGSRLSGWTTVFLGTTLATNVTAFGFPFVRFLPAHGVAIVSLIVLAVAIHARYRRHLAGPWRAVYVISAILSLYFNVFIGVVQAFLKVPALTAMAPTQSEPPFLVVQIAVLAMFIWLGVAATKGFRTA
jgi:hypothetical protein